MSKFAPFSSLWGTMFCYCWTMNNSSNCRTAKLWKWIIWDQYMRRKAGKSIFGLDSHSCFETAWSRFLFVTVFGDDFPGGEAGQPCISTEGDWAPSTPLDVSTGYIPHAHWPHTTATHSPQPSLQDNSSCGICRERGTASLPEPHSSARLFQD